MYRWRNDGRSDETGVSLCPEADDWAGVPVYLDVGDGAEVPVYPDVGDGAEVPVYPDVGGDWGSRYIRMVCGTRLSSHSSQPRRIGLLVLWGWQCRIGLISYVDGSVGHG